MTVLKLVGGPHDGGTIEEPELTTIQFGRFAGRSRVENVSYPRDPKTLQRKGNYIVSGEGYAMWSHDL